MRLYPSVKTSESYPDLPEEVLYMHEKASNADQIAYWNSEAGRRWVAIQEQTDALFEEISERLFEAGASEPGQSALDIGCGCGATVLALAGRLGAGGRVVSVDV